MSLDEELEEIDYMLGGIISVNEEFRVILVKALAKLPIEIVEWAIENLFFISSSEEFWAFSLSKNEWGHFKGFVFLSEYLKDISEDKQAFYIAHEIAHQKLKHKSPVFSNLTEEEWEKQEKDADDLAENWLLKQR